MNSLLITTWLFFHKALSQSTTTARTGGIGWGVIVIIIVVGLSLLACSFAQVTDSPQ